MISADVVTETGVPLLAEHMGIIFKIIICYSLYDDTGLWLVPSRGIVALWPVSSMHFRSQAAA
jgi:hypothetical protein